ncbi:hypothetical protein QR680_004621 [Steinernema hermaphroditum]|uniref:Uncharacterized protein n=1 Tax=Steinernema hermaphroditum TaxID=289476 RepID=A0AA39LTZ1_9BILA|nr:hypothetical protein QR680_004621 [Steinernema hermaphroditum]
MWSIWGSLASASNLLLQKTSDALSITGTKERSEAPGKPSGNGNKTSSAPNQQAKSAELAKADVKEKSPKELEEPLFRRRKKSRHSRRDTSADDDGSMEQRMSQVSSITDSSHSGSRLGPKYAEGAQPFPRKKIGKVFWVKDGPVLNDNTDVDLPIDEEVLDDVVHGNIKLEKAPPAKSRFDPFGDVKIMMKDNAHFNEMVIFANTVRTTLRFRPKHAKVTTQTQKKINDPQVKWKDTITVIGGNKKKVTKPLKNVVLTPDITATMI